MPRQLPPDPAGFCGREEAPAEVHGVTAPVPGRAGRAVASAIAGMAGIGRTALAVHWAHRVADRFPRGQLYVSLRGFEDSEQPLGPGEALGGFLGALGVPSGDLPRGTGQRGALFREHTASRQPIVVLGDAQDEERLEHHRTGPAGTGRSRRRRRRLREVAAALR
ncbi:hypothetical protein [Streptomyces olivaceoviridis]|uniref:hypothetical protein n=1 Tax=Streptomyces olivaceoviridis TaxID=1921 RepID=UPI003700156E